MRKLLNRPKVSDAMVRIDGHPREGLRQALEHSSCVLRRVYDAATGKGRSWWVVINNSDACAFRVHRRTVERWASERWVDLFADSPRDYSPDTGNEWCCLRRCDRCDCVGYPIDGEGKCDECAGETDD